MKIFPWFLIVIFGVFAVGCGETTEDTTTTAFFKVTSSFTSGSAIPTKYANTGVTNGQNISIPLSWANVPAGTQSFALSMVDIHASNFVHWLALNITSSATSIAENASATASMPGTEYTNDFATFGYGGPQPPTAEAAHSYVITIYALNVTSESFTNNVSGNNLSAFNNAISGEVIGQAFLTGTFDR
jgi:Raf kinase inhibitor-like YbhB/YbcL family protein